MSSQRSFYDCTKVRQKYFSLIESKYFQNILWKKEILKTFARHQRGNWWVAHHIIKLNRKNSTLIQSYSPHESWQI